MRQMWVVVMLVGRVRSRIGVVFGFVMSRMPSYYAIGSDYGRYRPGIVILVFRLSLEYTPGSI
jgi:hypothetical protein